jgi:hypothetical protein
MALLMLCVASCATCPKVSFIPPTVPPEVTCPSATVKDGGVWINEEDAKALLKERVILRSIIEQYKAYWEKTQKGN